MLSFAYAKLVAEWTHACTAVGFDPYLGFLHQPRYGRPALALDLMEEFRPVVADSVVVKAINQGVVSPSDFVQTPTAAHLNAEGKKKCIQAFERRMAEEITHPIFGYKVDYRSLFEVQARLLGQYLMGDMIRTVHRPKAALKSVAGIDARPLRPQNWIKPPRSGLQI